LVDQMTILYLLLLNGEPVASALFLEKIPESLKLIDVQLL